MAKRKTKAIKKKTNSTRTTKKKPTKKKATRKKATRKKAAKKKAAKKKATKKKAKRKKKSARKNIVRAKVSTGPTELELWLHAPGMDALLRAGVGGLATVLESLEHENPRRVKMPGAPWKDKQAPWEITADRIILKFGEPKSAGEYLKRLFEYAFQIRKGEAAIDLPSTHGGDQTSVVRAQLQRGLLLTFLQHGQSRKGAKADVERTATIDDKQISYSLRPLTSYKHQSGYKDLIEKDGSLKRKALDISGTLYPGAAVRHNKFGVTKHEGTAAELLAAYFALIGTMALPINRGSAVLLVPEVQNLLSFGFGRQQITPTHYRDCLIGGVGDAVLGVYSRLRGQRVKRTLEVSAVSAFLFRPTVWASQQKSRVAAERIEPLDSDAEVVFRYAAQNFAPAMKSRTVKVGKGKNTKEKEEYFWSISMVKPLIADNLANGLPWFHDFAKFYTRNDPATGKSLRDRLFFEKEGLIKMVNSDVWDDKGEKALVTGVHYALFCQFGKISSEFGSNKGGMKNKFQKEFEKWRIQFVSSKTADQFRFAVCDLMSRARGNNEIQENWQQVLPLLSDANWQHGRDLALLALASYKGKGDKELNGDADVIAT